MTVPRRVRVAPLLLTLVLVSGPVAAAAHRPGEEWQPRASVTGLLSEAWALLSRIWGKEGSSIDPFGKAGSGIDPFGKAGSEIDPFGNPTPNAQPSSNSSSLEDRSSGK